ncbi:hypothetical protein [Colwellia echini]|uniref:LPP20 lipoprotein n=1 Tax=Colwellia echini TaxID=1982103 RepID=A0ABY3N1N6_9GAMM|nr:hypothetical protein [Colwellia echini]TYK67360.1 hypothetical protein CWS31_002220 [Colwellia echini]
MFKKLTGLTLATIFVTGCSVTPAKVALQKNSPTHKVNVYSVIEQEQLNALYPIQDSSAVSAQFGLVGALVGGAIDGSANNSAAETAEENLVAIRYELKDLDFDQIFEEEINKKLSGNVNVDKVRTLKSKDAVKDELKTGEVYLELDTQYMMDMDFRTPFIVTNVKIAEKNNKKSTSSDKVLYKNTFTYFGTTLPVPVKELNPELEAMVRADWKAQPYSVRSDKVAKSNYKKRLKAARRANNPELDFDEANVISANAWSTEYKEELQNNLRKGIQNLFTLIASDIKDSTDPLSYAKKGVTMKGYPKNHKSVVVVETEEMQVIRFTEGTRAGAICAMPNIASTEKLVCL